MKLFVSGISTDVGKTLASAIIVEALEADYWKPIQAGDLDYSDTHKVKQYITNTKSVFHSNAYALHTACSPHLAAELDGIRIDLKQIKEPDTKNHLVIEGAGGLLVPLNEQDSVVDLIKADHQLILVCRHYLGSINHSLLSIEALRLRAINIGGIIFSGAQNNATESIILARTGIPCIGRIEEEASFDAALIREYANRFKEALLSLE